MLFPYSVWAKSTTQQLDSLMGQFQERRDFSGAVLVAEKGTIIYKKAFGYANREWGVQNTLDTKFRIASLTKQFTALLILQLIHEGKVKLEGKIHEYLPDYPEKSGQKVTIHQLLTHSSGIPNYHIIPDYDAEVAVKKMSTEQQIALFKDKDLLFEPGSDVAYTNFGYLLLAHIAEQVTGKSYQELIYENIFLPAGMTNSSLEEEGRLLSKAAYGYNNIYVGYVPASIKDPSSAFGSGNVITTVDDFYKFDRSLRSHKLLPKKYDSVLNSAHVSKYGYGWMIEKYVKPGGDTVTLAYHDGGRDGFLSLAYRFIEDDKLVVIFTNVRPCEIYFLADNITNILYSKPVSIPKRSSVARFATTTESLGVDAAVAEYYRIQKEEKGEYELNGSEFNLLGYTYLRKGKLKEALAVFKINVEAYPGYADPYDSLAEAYMKLGSRELAILNYKKSLELDPNNSNARVMLKKLDSQ